MKMNDQSFLDVNANYIYSIYILFLSIMMFIFDEHNLNRTFYACVLCSPGNDENKDSKITSCVSIYLYACLFSRVHMCSTVMVFGG